MQSKVDTLRAAALDIQIQQLNHIPVRYVDGSTQTESDLPQPQNLPPPMLPNVVFHAGIITKSAVGALVY